MKKKQIKRKLSFDKLTIAKLSNVSMIKGGSGIYSEEQNMDYTVNCPTVITCTVTGIHTNTSIGRPTQGLTKCNCDL
ncbi:class I lanthipeptide [uncultured Aquimarina sp.]|uniref:class I lanthipeptide n=1 Tax=uncultured Aquimarina sp. TaxID=575652 RepID=UPI002609D2C4|nr:class I lanthipeptide [uncultured Aquimarina sp.]